MLETWLNSSPSLDLQQTYTSQGFIRSTSNFGNRFKMKFSTRINVDVSPTQLFDRVADFDRLERVLMQNGASVERIDPALDPGTRMGWNVAFRWRGKQRKLRIEVDRYDWPDSFSMVGQSDSLGIMIGATVIGLNRKRSRLIFEMEISPRNMRARLMIQTAKLGKARLDRRFEKRVQEFIGDLAS